MNIVSDTEKQDAVKDLKPKSFGDSRRPMQWEFTWGPAPGSDLVGWETGK